MLVLVLVLVLEGWAGLVQGRRLSGGARQRSVGGTKRYIIEHEDEHEHDEKRSYCGWSVFVRREAATYFSIAINRLAAELRSGSTISGTGANGKSWAPGREMKAARQPAHIAPATSQP